MERASRPWRDAAFRRVFAAGDVCFEASFASGPKSAITALVDRNDSGHAAVATGTVVVAPRASMRGAPCAAFSTTQVLTSNRAAALWSFLNNTPSHQFLVLEPANATFGIWTETGAGGANGTNIISNVVYQTILSRDVGTQALSSVAVAPSTPVILEVIYDKNAATARSFKVSGQTLVTGPTIANADGVCTSPLTIGARAGGSFGMTGFFRAYFAFGRVLSAAHRELVYRHLFADTNIAP